MGQGTVDLPDPLDAQQPDAGNAAGVDDLLAQLAGDEIDRLLAENDNATASAPAAPPVAVVVEEPPTPQQTAESVAAEFESAAAETADLEMKATLDALAADLEMKKLDEPPLVIPPEAVEKVLAEAAANDVVQNKVVAEAEQHAAEAAAAAERAALQERAALKEEPETVLVPDAASTEEAATPLWLRPLEVLSAPLDSTSPGVRDAIGKMAILTTFNAVAVLIYVLIFRKH